MNPATEPNPEDIARLLTPLQEDPDRILVQRTAMGVNRAYLGAVSLEWAATRIRYASELPLFRPHRDRETGNVERGAETIETILQRPLDWSRQAVLVQYLMTHDWDRKFPPLVVVLSPEWVDDPEAPEWDEDGKATRSAAEFTALDARQQFGLLNLSPAVSVFALDGQHRLMGIQGVRELAKMGKLQSFSKIKKPLGAEIDWDDLAPDDLSPEEKLSELNRETIGVEFIPAVLPGETREQAIKRVRSLFVHVNQMGVKLSKGQLAVLDENDGFSIVCRQVAVRHPLLKDEGDRNPRINWDSATVATKSTVLTTLQALRDMAEGYLSPHPIFNSWKATKPGLIPDRPDGDELRRGIDEFMRFFDGLAGLPSYRKLRQGLETPAMRRFGFERPPGEGNILFRPVGQVAIAQAVGKVVFLHQKSPESVWEKLEKFDAKSGFSGMEDPASLWYGVLYDPNKRRVRVAGRSLAANLLIYLLGGIEDPMSQAMLRRDLADARTFENRAIDFGGRIVKPRQVGLPDPLD